MEPVDDQRRGKDEARLDLTGAKSAVPPAILFGESLPRRGFRLAIVLLDISNSNEMDFRDPESRRP